MKEQIETRLTALKEELAALQASHGQLVTERNQREEEFGVKCQANQHRFQQLNGAIQELTQLLNGEKP